MTSISLFEIRLCRRDLDQWEGTRQEMEMIQISQPKEIPEASFSVSTYEALCYNIDGTTLQGLEDNLLCQAPVKWERQIKLCIWSYSWSRVVQAWQSFVLAQRFAVMIDGKKFPNSDDLAAAAGEIAAFGGCDFPYFEPSRNGLNQYRRMASCYNQINPLIEWCQYHRATLQNAGPAFQKFRSTEEMRALLPARFGRWTWSQVRMAQLLMPCTSDAELTDAVTALFCSIVPSMPVTSTAPSVVASVCMYSAWTRNERKRLENQERYAALREAWTMRALHELEEERTLDELHCRVVRSLSFLDDGQDFHVECA